MCASRTRRRVGPVGAGWKVALTTLMNERHGMRDAPGPDFNELFALAREVELEDGLAIDNAAVQEKLAEFYVRSQGLKFTKFRGMTALSRGQTPGPGILHHQGGGGEQIAGHSVIRAGHDRHGGSDDG